MENFSISNFNRSSKSKPTNRRNWSAPNSKPCTKCKHCAIYEQNAKLYNADTLDCRNVVKVLCTFSFRIVYLLKFFCFWIQLVVSMVGKLFWHQNREYVSAFELWIYLFFFSSDFKVHRVCIRYTMVSNSVTAVLLQINWKFFILLTKIPKFLFRLLFFRPSSMVHGLPFGDTNAYSLDFLSRK